MPRTSPLTFAFESPAQALAALVAAIHPVPTESIPITRASGRILAQPITADRPSPAVDMSSMDGYAVRIADLTTDALPIAGEVRIGREPPPLPVAWCLRIVTGAPIPPGADAVIKREDVAEHADRIGLPRAIRIHSGQNIRRAGENLRAGDVVLAGGTVITSSVCAAMATFGVVAPVVHRRIRVRLMTTGDEVVPPSRTPTPWQLRDSNAAALHGLLDPLSWIDLQHTHVPDDSHAMHAAVDDAIQHADALLCTGGVSMGHRDLVADALAAAGILAMDVGVGGHQSSSPPPRGRTVFHGLPQRPGKPVLGAVTSDGRPILALPGNPVSVMVTARRLAISALLARAGYVGCDGGSARIQLVSLSNPDQLSIALYHHRLARITSPGCAELVDVRSSGDIVGAARADGFIEVAPHQTGLGPWPFYPWNF